VKDWKIAKPRTREAKIFCENAAEILDLRFN